MFMEGEERAKADAAVAGWRGGTLREAVAACWWCSAASSPAAAPATMIPSMSPTTLLLQTVATSLRGAEACDSGEELLLDRYESLDMGDMENNYTDAVDACSCSLPVSFSYVAQTSSEHCAFIE